MVRSMLRSKLLVKKSREKQNARESESKAGEGELDKIIGKAIILACILGLIVTLWLVMAIREESFSALYLRPESYSNYVEGNEVSFAYGVRCFENQKTRYELEIFLGDELVDKKEFEMEKGENEWTETIDIPNEIEFPVKVRLVLKANDEVYDTHFWLKGRK